MSTTKIRNVCSHSIILHFKMIVCTCADVNAFLWFLSGLTMIPVSIYSVHLHIVQCTSNLINIKMNKTLNGIETQENIHTMKRCSDVTHAYIRVLCACTQIRTYCLNNNKCSSKHLNTHTHAHGATYAHIHKLNLIIKFE